MATRISTAARNAAVSGVVELLDAGSGPGYVEIREGGQPATGDTAATGGVLATVVLADPAFAVVSAGVATADSIAVVSGTDDGDAGWFRAFDSDDNAVIDGNITISGAGGDMQLNTVTISIGVDFAVTSWTITMPGA